MKDFEYKDVPKRFYHCFNAQCTRSAECLSFLVASNVDAETPLYTIVNPAYVATKIECPFFRKIQILRYARGIARLFDNIPHAKAISAKRRIISHFGKTLYYRVFNKERLLNPEDIDFVRQVFTKLEIAEEPAFDEYVDQYDWS